MPFLAIISRLSLKSNAACVCMCPPLSETISCPLQIYFNVNCVQLRHFGVFFQCLPCDVILSHQSIRWNDYLLHKSNGYHEKCEDNKIDKGSYDSKCYSTRGMGGTRFAMMCFKGWVGGQNG